MRVLILHGWENNSKGNWFQWLKKELEAKDIVVYCPDLPDSDFPRQKEWLDTIRKAIGKIDEGLVIIGHSLGAVAILRLLETLGKNECIGTAILVSGFTDNHGNKAIADFFRTPFDWEQIKTKSKRFIVISSDDDPYIQLKEGKLLKKNLGAEFIVEHNAGHINKQGGFLRYERARDLILAL